jgi:hypothetical protein
MSRSIKNRLLICRIHDGHNGRLVRHHANNFSRIIFNLVGAGDNIPVVTMDASPPVG